VDDFYERLKESYDEKFYEQEVLGSYLSMDGGRVYSSFDREVHVRETRVNPGLPLLWSLDFNVDPMASVIAQVSGEMVWVVDEIYLRNSTTKEACEEFIRRYPKHDRGVVIYGDTSGNQRQTTGSTDYEMIREYFAAYSRLQPSMHVEGSNPRVRNRVNRMNRQFKSAAGTVGIAIDPKCKELIRDFEEVSYKADSPDIDKNKDRLRTHSPDALGYLVWQETEYRPKGGLMGQRII
jgi:hypothetical protein